jgi:expansin (peptidoglycan-binding protein)
MRVIVIGLLAVVLGGCSETPSARDGLPATDGPGAEASVPPGDGPGPEQAGPLPEAGSDAVAADAVTPGDKGVTPDGPSPFPLQNGKITYYNADGSGNCSFPASPNDLMVAAMNQVEYDGSAACGECVKVNGPKGSVVVRIVDRCPECLKGHIDLSKEAFAKIADLALGVVQVTWQVVPCQVSGPIIYHFKDGSNQWWTAIQVRNHRYAIKSLEAQVGGSFQPLPREMYNYFVASSGLGPGPYTLRVTDVLGHVLVDSNIPFKVNQEVPGAAQFPP